jgi:hypothetical protein
VRLRRRCRGDVWMERKGMSEGEGGVEYSEGRRGLLLYKML